MLQKRVIPCLLLRDGGLVKTERFRKHKYVGDPINAVRIFNEKEVDELIFIDIDASKNGSEPQWNVLEDLASECFMPFSYGGGITNEKQIERLLKIGIEKVVINSASFNSFSLLERASKLFGSSTIIGGIDCKRNLFGKTHVYNHITGKSMSLSPVSYAHALEFAGAGEIFLNNVDRDGTYQGYDVDLIKSVAAEISIPLIACGGASSFEDFRSGFTAGASALAAGSIFVYQGPHRAVLISYPPPMELQNITNE